MIKEQPSGRGEERRGERKKENFSEQTHCDHYANTDRPALPSISELAAQPLGQTPSDIKATINNDNTCPTSPSHRHKHLASEGNI